MRRVPLPIVIVLCLLVVGLVWWQGTKGYDFLTPPPEDEIAFARMRAAGQLATPSDLFAVEPLEESNEQPIKPPAPPPEPPPPTPLIDPGDLEGDPELDAWAEHAGKPTASYINLASALETATHFQQALLAWERVLDTASPNAEELETAIKGVRRLRATLSPWNEDSEQATKIELEIHAPKDRTTLAKRAAEQAAKTLSEASSGIVRVTVGRVHESPPTAASPKLHVILKTADQEEPPEVIVPSPKTAEEIELEILSSSFKLIGSQLALRDDLRPLSAPEAGEKPGDSLQDRITRLAWKRFAESLAMP